MFACLQGAAVYAPEKEAMVWKIKNFPGGKEFLLRCKFGLPSVEAEEEAKGRMPPIRVKFEIPYFTVSGIQVRFSVLLVLMMSTCIIRLNAPRVMWPDKVPRSDLYGIWLYITERLVYKITVKPDKVPRRASW